MRLLGRRPDPALVHLPVAGLDPESLAVGRLDPVGTLGSDPPVGIHPGVPLLPSVPIRQPVEATQIDTVAFCFLASWSVWVKPPTLLHQFELVRPAGSFGMVGLAAEWQPRHGERPPGLLQVADDRHAVKAAVQWRSAGSEPRLARQGQQLLEHVLEQLGAGHRGHGQGEPLAVEHDVCGGVGEERVGAGLGLGPVDLTASEGMLAMIGEECQIDGDAERSLAAAAQGPGRVGAEGSIGLLLSCSKQKRLA